MSIEDDEIHIDTLETKLKFASSKLDRLLAAIQERKRRESFGVINDELKKELIEAAQQVANRVQQLEDELEKAINVAGLPPERRPTE
jgi:hypothetical protein